MKVLILMLSLSTLYSFSGQAAGDPACSDFKYIQSTMRAINSTSVDRAVPHADWLDRRYRREDQIALGTSVAKTVVLVLLQRLSFWSFVLTPDRAEAATVTGSYVRSPEAYSRFLHLVPERACPILRYGGSDGQLLRDVTHEVARELRRAR